MDLGERIHGLNLLCGAMLSDSKLRIAMQEVDNNNPDQIMNKQRNHWKSIMEAKQFQTPTQTD